MSDQANIPHPSNQRKPFTKIMNDYAEEMRKSICNQNQSNLLEIKLKNLDSVPEVYYKGELLFDKRLASVKYDWETTGDTFGKQLIEIVGYDIDGRNQWPSTDTIKHERLT